MKMRFANAFTFLALAFATACATANASVDEWVGTWTAPPQLTEPRNMPPAPGLANATLRQHIRLTVGGSSIRLRFSNEFGDGPIVIAAATVARSAGDGAMVPRTDVGLTFGGASSVVIAPGDAVLTDPLEYAVAQQADLAVTTRFTTVPAGLTGHPGSRTTSYFIEGDAVSTTALEDAYSTDHWYVLSRVDVLAPTGTRTVVTLGNSITDGRGSTTNGNDRWPDNLARRLLANPATANVAVVNAGIGGNTILRGGLGPTALARLDRDVLDVPGARWVIVLEGVNDIGTASPETIGGLADELIAAYTQIVERAHERGMLAYGATILPFGESFYDSPEREAARHRVNEWIRSGGVFDAVIDFDATMRDPDNPSRLRAEADTGDHLHPNQNGYRMMAESIDLTLFR